MKKCDEQLIIRDEQARGGENGGGNESGFFRQEDRIYRRIRGVDRL
jgi:hypothetical protein